MGCKHVGGGIVILIKLPLTIETSLFLTWTCCEGTHCKIPRLWQTLASYINSFYFYQTPVKLRNSQLKALSFCNHVCFLRSHKSHHFPCSEQNLNQIPFPHFRQASKLVNSFFTRFLVTKGCFFRKVSSQKMQLTLVFAGANNVYSIFWRNDSIMDVYQRSAGPHQWIDHNRYYK